MSNTQRNHLLHVLTAEEQRFPGHNVLSLFRAVKPDVDDVHVNVSTFRQLQNANDRRRPHFYCVKINPKDIRRSCGQKLVAPAPFAPQACPL